MSWKTLLKAARLPFLALTPICILYAFALAHIQTPTISLVDTAIILVGAIAAHLAVNLLNEYQDFKSGLDFMTNKTAFSGGSGALPKDPASAKLVLMASQLCLVVVFLVGVYFLPHASSLILAIGISGVLLILTYTNWINKSSFICLIAPGFGFGTLMILGSVLLLSKHISIMVFILSLVMFFQVNNLLLLNQYPDIKADEKVGRHHFPIAFGTKISSRVYGVFMLIPFIIIAFTIYIKILPLVSAITLLFIVPGFAVYRAALHHGAEIKDKYLATNVIITLLTPLLLSLSLLFN